MPSPTSLTGYYHDSDSLYNHNDPAMSWMWIAEMPVIAGGPAIKDHVTGSLPPRFIEEVEVTHNNVAARPRYGNGTRIYYPDVVDVAAVSITFYEDVAYTTTQYLYAWRALVCDADVHYGLPYGTNGYKKTINIYKFSTVGTQAIKFQYSGAWPTEMGAWALNASSERLRVTCSFAVDDCAAFVNGRKLGTVQAQNGTSGTALSNAVGAIIGNQNAGNNGGVGGAGYSGLVSNPAGSGN